MASIVSNVDTNKNNIETKKQIISSACDNVSSHRCIRSTRPHTNGKDIRSETAKSEIIKVRKKSMFNVYLFHFVVIWHGHGMFMNV